jgi:general secretion pathway protein L
VPDALALVLHPEDALVRQIRLPRGAEENLRPALAFELNRYTPFQASEVYFDYRLAERAFGERELTLQLAVAPKTRVDPALNLLLQAGARPAAVVLSDDLRAESVPLNFLPPERRPKRPPRVSASNTLLAALAVILAGVALALPVWQKQQAIAALTPQVESARRQAEGASRLKTELDALVQIHDFLLQRKHGNPSVTVVMEELTRVLPDGTWLQQLNLRSHPKGWEIQIQGETTISSRLARVIDDSPLFRDAGFKSPLIKGQAPASERFNLGAELESIPAPKPQRLADRRLPANRAAVPTPTRLVAQRP